MGLVYYVSFGDHSMLKCEGSCPDATHRRFYEAYFREHGCYRGRRDEGPFTVLVAEFKGDRVANPETDAERIARARAARMYSEFHDLGNLLRAGRLSRVEHDRRFGKLVLEMAAVAGEAV